ncbi:hypothetical protein EYR38_010539 [Pleurotus pulmonarius]|nr:hypothetical protein EYR38_010539 [Pleurotus pulmonarius]
MSAPAASPVNVLLLPPTTYRPIARKPVDPFIRLHASTLTELLTLLVAPWRIMAVKNSSAVCLYISNFERSPAPVTVAASSPYTVLNAPDVLAVDDWVPTVGSEVNIYDGSQTMIELHKQVWQQLGLSLDIDAVCFTSDQIGDGEEYNITFERWVGVVCGFRGPILLVARNPSGFVVDWQSSWNEGVRQVLRRLVSMRPLGLALTAMQVQTARSTCLHVNRTHRSVKKKGTVGRLPLELMWYIISYCDVAAMNQVTRVNPLYKDVVRTIMKNSVKSVLDPFFEDPSLSIGTFLSLLAQERGYICGDVPLAMDRGQFNRDVELHIAVTDIGAPELIFWLSNIGYTYAEISEDQPFSSRSIRLESEKLRRIIVIHDSVDCHALWPILASGHSGYTTLITQSSVYSLYTGVHDAGYVIAPEYDDLNERMASLNTRICPDGEGLLKPCGLACPSLSRRWDAYEGRDILAWGGMDGGFYQKTGFVVMSTV